MFTKYATFEKNALCDLKESLRNFSYYIQQLVYMHYAIYK